MPYLGAFQVRSDSLFRVDLSKISGRRALGAVEFSVKDILEWVHCVSGVYGSGLGSELYDSGRSGL